MSAEAVLFYGYDLGSPRRGGWKIREADAEGRFEAPWMGSMEGGVGYRTLIELALLKDAGFTGEFPVSLSDPLARRCGVATVAYGRPGTLGYGLALAGSVSRTRDLTARQVTPTLGGVSHEPLESALKVLGMTPLQPNPSWILAPLEF